MAAAEVAAFEALGCQDRVHMTRWVLSIAAWFLLACAAEAASGRARPPRSILVLNESAMVGPFYSAAYGALRSRLIAKTLQPISIFLEHLELERFGGHRHEQTVKAYFQSKYRDEPIGVIIAMGVAALEFVVRAQSEMWFEVPVAFVMVDETALQRLDIPANVTGRTTRVKFSDLVRAAHAVVPNLERIALLGDQWDRQTAFRHFKEEISAATIDLEIIDLLVMPMRDLRTRVAALPQRTAILYTSIFSDGEGTSYPPIDALALVAEVANRPIVIPAETFLGRAGGIGGYLLTPAPVGEGAAELALRILAGERPSAIPIIEDNVVRPIFDWRQLQRWGVSESRLPQGSEIRFRVPTMWEQYRELILAACAIVLVQAAMIAWLLAEHRRRRRSEAAAHELSGKLVTAQEEERARLARELHDDVTQRLASLAIDAGREERDLANSGRSGAIRKMREGLIRLSEDVHALSYRLHPAVLEDLGLIETLKSECERFSRTCQTHLNLEAAETVGEVPREVALCIFRIAQEALRNIDRHAKASRATVSLRRLDGGLQLTVRDDGAGFDSASHRGRRSLGHAGMRQRAFLLGGKVDIISVHGSGTTIRAWVPLEEGCVEPSARAAG